MCVHARSIRARIKYQYNVIHQLYCIHSEMICKCKLSARNQMNLIYQHQTVCVCGVCVSRSVPNVCNSFGIWLLLILLSLLLYESTPAKAFPCAYHNNVPGRHVSDRRWFAFRARGNYSLLCLAQNREHIDPHRMCI